MVGGAAVVREDREAGYEAETDGVRAPTGVDHRIAQRGCARTRSGDHRAASVGVDERFVERASFQNRPQMQRRAVGDVDEAGHADGGDVRVGFRVTPVHNRNTGHTRAEALEVGSGTLDRSLGMLERGRGRQHQDLVGTRELEQPGVERGARLGPLVAAHEGNGSGGPGHEVDSLLTYWVPCSRLGSYERGCGAERTRPAHLPAGSLPAFAPGRRAPGGRALRRTDSCRSSVWGSLGRESWARASPKPRSSRVSKSCCAADRRAPPTRWSPASRSRSPSRSTGASSKRPSCLLYTSDAADDLLCVDL